MASTSRSTSAETRSSVSGPVPTAAATSSRPRSSFDASGNWMRFWMSFTVISPTSRNASSTIGSFSMRCCARITFASSSVMGACAVTSPSDVITSWIGRLQSVSKRRSRLVSIPTSRPVGPVIGTPLILKRAMRSSASEARLSGPSVMGSLIIPDSERFTLSTSAA